VPRACEIFIRVIRVIRGKIFEGVVRMKKTGIIYTPRYMEHDTGGHVENARRVKYIREGILKKPWAEKIEWVEPRAATVDEIAMNHSREYVGYVKSACGRVRDIGYLNPDTAISPESYEVALLAAGGVLLGIDRLMEGSLDGFFAMVRPPGHHAEYDESLGFCLFNNIAIGARHAVEKHGLSRVFILDWDVHHGNGTEHSFHGEKEVFFCSLHQSPHYPGTGARRDMGEGRGLGYTMNFPMRSGSGNEEYLYLFGEIIAPAIRKFGPELLLVSAGFDAHEDDPLSGINLTDECFATFMDMVKKATGPGCPVGCVLEGGYNLGALGRSAAGMTGVLAGAEEGILETGNLKPAPPAVELAEYLKAEHPFLKNQGKK